MIDSQKMSLQRENGKENQKIRPKRQSVPQKVTKYIDQNRIQNKIANHSPPTSKNQSRNDALQINKKLKTVQEYSNRVRDMNRLPEIDRIDDWRPQRIQDDDPFTMNE